MRRGGDATLYRRSVLKSLLVTTVLFKRDGPVDRRG